MAYFTDIPVEGVKLDITAEYDEESDSFEFDSIQHQGVEMLSLLAANDGTLDAIQEALKASVTEQRKMWQDHRATLDYLLRTEVL